MQLDYSLKIKIQEIKMDIYTFKLILIVLIFSFGCDKSPNQIDQIEYREDLSESEFKEAIIGKWESVYETPGKANVDYLELTNYNNAKIIIKQDSSKKEYNGSYSIIFLRSPSEDMVTLAELTLKTSEENIISISKPTCDNNKNNSCLLYSLLCLP